MECRCPAENGKDVFHTHTPLESLYGRQEQPSRSPCGSYAPTTPPGSAIRRTKSEWVRLSVTTRIKLVTAHNYLINLSSKCGEAVWARLSPACLHCLRGGGSLPRVD